MRSTILSAVLLSLPVAGAAQAEDPRIGIAMLQPPRSGLSPLSDDAFKLSRWSTAETLVRLNADAEPQPLLATEWSRLDDHSWRFVIRPGVKFHDGTDVTPESVAAALTAATQATPKPRILDGVDITVDVDGDAVIVRTEAVDPLVPSRLSSPQLAILAAKAYGKNGVVTPPERGRVPSFSSRSTA